MHQTGRATDLVDKISSSLVETSNESIDNCLDALDTCAGLIESLEDTMAELGPSNALKELQRELWPLLIPAVALMVIITVGNCFFGFALSRDVALARTFAIHTLFGDEQDGESADDVNVDDVNVLNLFATFHVILICLAALYVLAEIVRSGQEAPSSGNADVEDLPSAGDEDSSVDSVAFREDVGLCARSTLAGDIPRFRRPRWDVREALEQSPMGADEPDGATLSPR